MLKQLSRKYEPDQLIERRFERYDLSFKTDQDGNPVILFIGTRENNGKIKGERYARRLLENTDGTILKDHWDHKGKATAQIS